MLLSLLAFYYLLAARAELTPLFRWSVWVRAAVLPILLSLVAAGVAPPILLLIGVVDLSGAIWTALALPPASPGDRFVDRFGRTRAGTWILLHVFTPLDRRLMRWSRGRLSMSIGSHLYSHMLLLLTTGARSGRERAAPVIHVPLGEDLVLVASRGGRDENPAWYHNLRAHPTCRVVYGGRRVVCTAREAEGGERKRLWNAALELYPSYADYAGRTERRIPVMVLTPVGDARRDRSTAASRTG
jgi:deazaflavin-dependent oxidoreductase (nitroreductase family)